MARPLGTPGCVEGADADGRVKKREIHEDTDTTNRQDKGTDTASQRTRSVATAAGLRTAQPIAICVRGKTGAVARVGAEMHQSRVSIASLGRRTLMCTTPPSHEKERREPQVATPTPSLPARETKQEADFPPPPLRDLPPLVWWCAAEPRRTCTSFPSG